MVTVFDIIAELNSDIKEGDFQYDTLFVSNLQKYDEQNDHAPTLLLNLFYFNSTYLLYIIFIFVFTAVFRINVGRTNWTSDL